MPLAHSSKPELPIACVAALAILLSACGKSGEAVHAGTTPAEEMVVPVAIAKRTDITGTTALTAEFEPFQEVDVMAKVSGYVQSMKVDLGDRVREGQLLAVLEIPEMRDDLSKATATIQQTDAEIVSARDELARLERSHEMAHLSFTRIQEVAKREPGLIPLQEVDEIRSRDLVAEAQIATAKSNLRVAEQRTQVAKADQARVRTMNNYVSITAPFAGTVTKRYANTGSMIQAGTASQSQAMPLVRLSQNSLLRLSLPVPESMVSTVHVGDPVDVHVASLARTFGGKIARFAGKVDQGTRTMITEVDVPNPSAIILPGMYAEVSLRVASHSAALSVPLEAVERAGATTRVYVVDKTGLVQIVTVQLGLESSQRAEILSGVQEGDQVITGRRSALKNGEKVRVKVMEI